MYGTLLGDSLYLHEKLLKGNCRLNTLIVTALLNGILRSW